MNMRLAHNTLVFLAGTFLVGAFLAGCSAEPSHVIATRRDMVMELGTYGTLRAGEAVMIETTVTDLQVERIYVALYDRVEEGTPLFVLEPSSVDELRQRTEQMEGTVGLLEARVDTNRKSHEYLKYGDGEADSSALELARQVYEESMRSLNSTKTEYDARCALLDRIDADTLEYLSPMAGTVTGVHFRQEGKQLKLLEIADSAALEIRLACHNIYMLPDGAAVTVAIGGTEYPALLSDRDGALTATLESAEDYDALVAGGYFPVDITVEKFSVLCVPRDCLTYRAGKAFVTVTGPDGARDVEVTTGLIDTDDVEILEGLEADSTVITATGINKSN